MSKLAVLVKTRTQPGKRAEVRRLYEKHLAPRAPENQAQEVVVFCEDQNDPDAFYLYEARMATLWPLDDAGLVIGEDTYTGGNGFDGIAGRKVA